MVLVGRHGFDAPTLGSAGADGSHLNCAAMAPRPGPSTPSDSADRLRRAWQLRPRTDYVFDFWTAVGWILLTVGFYAFYVLYQLVRRSRDHNARRLEFLDAATTFAWEEAQLRDLTEEFRPYVERMATGLESLRRSTRDFRDPVIWLLLSMVSFGVTGIVAAVLLNRDLIAHDEAEKAIEADLVFAFGRLDRSLAAVPDPSRVVGRHNAVGRVMATIVSLGLYGFWWGRDLMLEGNAHFAVNRPFEDEVVSAVGEILAA